MPSKSVKAEEDVDSTYVAELDVESIKEELFEERKILLNEPITENVVYSIFHPMEKLLYSDDKAPITLYINSCGGNAFDSLFLCSYFSSIPVKVNTICLGTAQSGAAYLLLSGSDGHRKAYRYSTIMLHLPASDIPKATSNNLLAQAKGIEMLDEEIYELMMLKTKMSKKLIKSKMGVDWYLTPKMALKYGIIDVII